MSERLLNIAGCELFIEIFNSTVMTYGVVRLFDLYDEEVFGPLALDQKDSKASYYNYGWTRRISYKDFEYVTGVERFDPLYKIKLPKAEILDD